MKIDNIKIHNFKSIRDYSMDFNKLKGLWEITGPVGAGKTSLSEALIYGLFGSVKDKNVSDLITWGEKKMEVQVSMESKGHTIDIIRSAGTGSKFMVNVDGTPLISSKKTELQKELEANYYDISKLTLETLCIISFKGFKSLATLTPADSRKFLNSTFGLEVITDLSDLAKEHKNDVNSEMSHLQTEIVGLDSQKKVYDNFFKIEEKFTQDEVDVLLRDQESQKSIYAEIKQKSLNEYNEVSKELSSIKRDQGIIEAKGREVAKNINFISKGVCPTCGAKLDTSNLNNYIKERDELRDKYKEISEKGAEVQNLLNEISQKGHKELEEVNSKLTDISKKLTKAQEYLVQEKKCTQNIEEIDKKREEVQKDLTKLECEYNEWQDLAKILESESRPSIISTIIPSLNKKISEYCAALAFNYSIIFNDQFKCVIKNNNLNIEIPISSLSTGQLKTVDIVIIMAILDILMNGCDFNIHFLDELFSNMDIELRGKMCEILKSKQNSEQSIFVISHASLPSNSIDGTIEIDLKNGNSIFQDTL